MARIATESPNMSRYWEYGSASSLYVAADRVITGVAGRSPYTLLMPNNDAIQQAIDDGVLPANPASADFLERNAIENFIKYHIINNVNIDADGNHDLISVITALKDENDETQKASLTNAVGTLVFVNWRNGRGPAKYIPRLCITH